MRLLHIITALHTGGAERMLADLSHAWANQVELHVAYLKPIDTLAPLFHPATHLHPIGLDFGTVSRLRKLIRTVRPDVVHTHLLHADGLGLLAAKGLPVQTWTTLHNARFRTGRSDALFQAGYRFLLGTLSPQTQLVAISQAVAYHAQTSWGIKPERMHVVRNPLKVPQPQVSRQEARRHLDLSTNELVLVFLGRLEQQKGVAHLIDALGLLKAQGLTPTTYIVGEGSLSQELRLQAQTLSLGQVRFTGLSAEPGLYLSAADALVLPSLFEGLGNVIAEAFAFGLPVVASDLEGPAEIIQPGQTGLLVPPADPAALAQAISQLLTDDGLHTSMSRAARQVAAAWPTPENYAQALLRLYGRH